MALNGAKGLLSELKKKKKFIVPTPTVKYIHTQLFLIYMQLHTSILLYLHQTQIYFVVL